MPAWAMAAFYGNCDLGGAKFFIVEWYISHTHQELKDLVRMPRQCLVPKVWKYCHRL
jgi:hypothetical protein